MKKIKTRFANRRFALVGFLLLSACAAFFEGSEGLTLAPADVKPIDFVELPVDWRHAWDDSQSYHLVASAAIDVDEDGQFEVFVGGGLGQPDALLSYQQGKVMDKIKSYGLSSLDASYGATAIDINNNGLVDLIVMRDKGATIYYKNKKGKFNAQPLPLNLPPQSVALNATPIDIDQDGDIDLYISIFIDKKNFRSVTYNDSSHRRYNILLRNVGTLQGKVRWLDITDKTTQGLQNSFTAVSVDLNKDRLQDIVIAQNTGQVEVLQNIGKGKFKRRALNTGFGFWMGAAVGDIDQDGDIDMLFSNSGSSITSKILMGDLKEGMRFNGSWSLQRNDGNFRFTDISTAARVADLGFGWGAVFEDMNYDGTLDLFGAQNYINWPLHYLYKIDGKILLGAVAKGESVFYRNPSAVGKNYYFAHTPLLVDFDFDGRKDLLWVNADGPLKVFLNKTKGRFVAVQVPDNAAALGAVLKLRVGDRTYYQQITSSQGLTTDQPPVFVFGLGETKPATKPRFEITWANGKKTRHPNLPLNKVLRLQPAP